MGILDRNNAHKVCEPEELFLHTTLIPKLADFQKNCYYMTKNNFMTYCGRGVPYNFFEYLIENGYVISTGYHYGQKEIHYMSTQKFVTILRLYAARKIVERYESKRKVVSESSICPEVDKILTDINRVSRDYEYALAKQFIEENE